MSETQRDIAEYQTDHDLLVVLNERMTNLISAVKGKNDDHEERIRWLEKRGWMLAGAAIGISTIIGWILQVYHS